MELELELGTTMVEHVWLPLRRLEGRVKCEGGDGSLWGNEIRIVSLSLPLLCLSPPRPSLSVSDLCFIPPFGFKHKPLSLSSPAVSLYASHLSLSLSLQLILLVTCTCTHTHTSFLSSSTDHPSLLPLLLLPSHFYSLYL